MGIKKNWHLLIWPTLNRLSINAAFLLLEGKINQLSGTQHIRHWKSHTNISHNLPKIPQVLEFFRHTSTDHFKWYKETAQFPPKELNTTLSTAGHFWTGYFRANWGSHGLGDHKATFSYGCCPQEKGFIFWLFILFQHPHFSSPPILLHYKRGAILLKLIKTQGFLFKSPPCNFILSILFSTSFQFSSLMNDTQTSPPTQNHNTFLITRESLDCWQAVKK